ncbi:hypothetical protein [Thermospira aquatica]|uniref:Uncharacterized protein n=1 Tax=Thermospira aquatica TaxID=2828656 RepID=A0AAX3BCJ2_9SPIR|nr:hypothetical protein [Thermospira aquatica]URA09870.1 hypothetical protein KDW03_10350 [Thermospira aquatica]
MRKFLFFMFALFSPVSLFSAELYGLPREVFVKRLNAREINNYLLEQERLLASGKTNYQTLWLISAGYYYQGEFYQTTKESRKRSFTLAKDYGLMATAFNPQGAEGFYWLAVAYALWSKENGILDSLFYADDVLEALNRCIELQSDYFDGVPWAMRALVYDLVPGWPWFGDKEKAFRDIQIALRYARGKVTERTVLGIYVDILTRNKRYIEATNALAQFTNIPWNSEFELEEKRAFRDISNSIEILKAKKYWQ